MEQLLNTMNQKLSFVLSAVSGTKEAVTDEDMQEIAYENETLAQAVEVEQEILFNETVEVETSTDDLLVQTLSSKLVNMVMLELGEYDDAEPEDYNVIAQSSTINNEDVKLLIRKRDKVIELFGVHSEEHYYKNLISTVEELTNG